MICRTLQEELAKELSALLTRFDGLSVVELVGILETQKLFLFKQACELDAKAKE